MKFEEIISNIKNRIFSPVYFLTGDQPYYIDRISDMFENDILSDDEKDFNLTVLYGYDATPESIIYQSHQYPMMSTYQIVIIKEAQSVKKIEKLEPYLDNPTPSTLLIFCYKYNKLDGRTSFAKKIKSKTVFYESPKIYDNEIPDWIISYCHKKGYTVNPRAALLLGNYIGTDLQKIFNELEKLFVAIENKRSIDESDIEKYIGISKDYNVFELQNAIGNRSIFKAEQIASYFADNEKAGPLPMIISVLYGFFAKVMRYHFIADKSRDTMSRALGINPFFLKDYSSAASNYLPKQVSAIFLLLQEYDLKGKGVDNYSSSQGDLIEELVYKIINR